MCNPTSNDTSGSSDNDNHVAEVDYTSMHTWIFEPATSDSNTKSLTDAGVEAIANHKYKPGHYTFFDNLLNPFWTALTELLPMWLAPNMVTFLGAMHCMVGFLVTWYHSPNFDTPVPDWVVFLGGYCTIAYYTFDCMDGKQARRTGQSSPLGQLFDHGFDCLCNLSHISTQAIYCQIGGTPWFFVLQGSLFFAFFCAQWEEYYTGSLPHAMGNFGVTEANYGMGLYAMWNAFIDRGPYWTTQMKDMVPEAVSAHLPGFILNMERRHIGLSIWGCASGVLIVACFYRVLTHPTVVEKKLAFSAVSKTATPLLVALAPFWLPAHVIQNETRQLSVAMGLLMSFLAKKMICFSMAKQSFAAIQMEAFPFLGVIILIKTDYSNEMLINDMVAKILLSGLCVWYAYRLIDWAGKAINQICERLDIYCFSIKHPKTKAA